MKSELSCEEVFQRLDDYLDRELSPEEMTLVSEHIAACDVCAAEHRFESGLLSSIKDKLRRVQIPEDMKQRLLTRLRNPPA